MNLYNTQTLWDYIENFISIDGDIIKINDCKIFTDLPEMFGFDIEDSISLVVPKTHASLVQVISNYGYVYKKMGYFILFSKNLEISFVKGKIESINDNPAFIWKINQKIYIRRWCKENLLHRDNDLPAIVDTFNNTNTPSLLKWFVNGELHRENGYPAVVDLCEDDEICALKWYTNGKIVEIKENLELSIIENNRIQGITIDQYYSNENFLKDIKKKIGDNGRH